MESQCKLGGGIVGFWVVGKGWGVNVTLASICLPYIGDNPLFKGGQQSTEHEELQSERVNEVTCGWVD